MRKLWQDDAWEEYLYWQTQDKKTLKRINTIIKDIIFLTYYTISSQH